MGSNRRMDHMTWPEFKEACERPVIVPIGSTEQHGQHLPIGTDAVLATRISEDLAERGRLIAGACVDEIARVCTSEFSGR